jgi:iron complex outermembrane receptor protein
MKSKHLGNFAVRTLPLLISAFCATNAYAQSTGVDEVLVSAQKRTERIQDVPMAISAISGQALENRKIEGAADLQGIIPNLNVVAAPVSGLIAATSIRGLGTGQPSIWMDPAIGMYVDGIFVGKNQGALFDLVDLERIEVLRGPQGTLFGRNTLGGAINFVTRQPSGQISGQVGIEAGNYGRLVTKVSIDTPKINETLSLTIAGRKEKQDGWLANPNFTEKWGNRNRESYKLNAKFDVSKDTKFFYSMDQSNINETTSPMSLIKKTGYCTEFGAAVSAGLGCFPSYFNPGLGAAITPYLQAGVPTSTSSTFEPIQAMKVTGHNWIAETAIDKNNQLKYIGSYRTMRYNDQGDLDGTPVNVFSGTKLTNYSTHSHELQLVGSYEKINYVTGLYLFKDEGSTVQNQIGGFFSFSPLAIRHRQTNFGLGTDAKAVYGQLDYPVTPTTTLTAGLRHTSEEKTGSVWRSTTVAYPMVTPVWQAGMAPGDVNAKAKFSSTTPTIALNQKLDSNTMVFGRIAKGFKSGGFPLEAPTLAQATTAFKPEESTSHELGMKGKMGDSSYAATVFSTNLKNQQVSYLPVGSTSPTTTNAGASSYQGLELEGSTKLSKDTKVQFGYGYLDAKFDEYMSTGIKGAVVNAANNLVVSYAPKHTFNLNIESNLANTEMGKLRGLLEYRYTAAYSNYPANISMTDPNAIAGNNAADSKMPAVGVMNARLILDRIPMGGPGQADASLWVKNLGNKQYMQNMIDVSGYYQVGYWSAPRTVGVSLNYKW